MAVRYVFKEPRIGVKNAARADPDAIGRELARVTAENGGRLTTRAALNAARRPRSAMHRHIEWDDAVAAEAHRRDQMSELIRIVIVEDDEQDAPPRRAFISISDPVGRAYYTVDKILDNRELQLEILRQALRDIRALEERYRDLQEICQLVRVAGRRLEARITEEEREPPRGRGRRRRRDAGAEARPS